MKRTSTQIILIYMVVGFLWIISSDWLFTLLNYPENPIYQTIKGCGFIAISGLVFLYMLRKYEDRNSRYLQRLKDLNKNLIVRAKELSDSNAELEQFAYVASHDLQEPLRMVTGFLTQIEKKYHPLLDDRGKQYIFFAVDGAARMRKMILDLLEYSRLGKRNFKIDRFDTNLLILEILQLNKTLLGEENARVLYDKLPVISAGRTQILQVFQNLILNAVKYRKPNITPIIEIKSTESAQYWKFSVSDNGIGINKEYLQRIFVLFQRLHSREEYSGTGIGLAICKKIIDNHNGQIWAESDQENGSTFYFSIRK